MTMKYFRLTHDVHYPDRWYLGEVEGIDNWALVSTTLPAETSGTFTVKLYETGKEMDFTMNVIYSVPIVSASVKDALVHLPRVRFFPARIEETSSTQPRFIMVIDDQVDAVDESRSEFNKFTVDDTVRPDMAGQYRGFFKLAIDEVKASGHPIFRLRGFQTAIIIDESVKRALDATSATGLTLTAL